MIHYPIYVKRVRGKGWGAFCSKKIPKKKIFNVTTLLVLNARESRLMSGSCLEPYWYAYGSKGRAIALGLGSIMNHSDKPNCSYYLAKKKRTLSFYALRDIPANEELTHNYGWSKSSYEMFGVKLEKTGQKKKPKKNRAK